MKTLNQPLHLPCGVEITNRICKSAMTEAMANPHGHPTPFHSRLYQRWSEGGAGLLITGNMMIDVQFLERAGNIVLDKSFENDYYAMQALKEWAKAGTKGGNHLWAQLNHPGRQCARNISKHPISPSSVQLDLMGSFAQPREMSEADIRDVINRFGIAARIAKDSGFTGVQIHSAHGYLGSQFLSPLTNRRNDQWGGSLENRSRFLLEIISAVRKEVGSYFPIGVKLNSSDFQKGGFSLSDSTIVAKWLGEEGIDLLEISGGSFEQTAFIHGEIKDKMSSTSSREAYFLKYAKTIGDACTMPLMITGGFRNVRVMEEAIDAGETDMIGIARPFCLSADFPQKLLAGELLKTPDANKKLVLGKGILSEKSSLEWVKAINNLGQSGWYGHQMRQLARGKKPNLNLGILSAFFKHIYYDSCLNFRRKRETKANYSNLAKPPLSKFTPELLENHRQTGDPLADRVVKGQMQVGNLKDNIDTLAAISNNLMDKDNKQFIDQVNTIPDWLDTDKLELARQVFLRNSLISSLAGLMSGWLEVYSAPIPAKVLLATGRQQYGAWRRVFETNQMFLDLFSKEGLLPGNPGHQTLVKVRLIHSGVRLMVKKSNRWDKGWGEPICQQDLAGAMTIFSYTLVRSLQKLGVPLTEDELNAYQHLWRYVGYLLGIETVFLVENHADQVELYESIRLHRISPDDNSRLLVQSLIKAISFKPPFYLPHRAFYQFARILLGKELANKLELPSSFVWYLLFKTLYPYLYTKRTLQRVLPFVETVQIAVGEFMIKKAVQYGLKGNPAKFDIPGASELTS